MANLKLPDLDACVLAALRYFKERRPTKLDLKRFSFPIVVGSGNAYNTGLVLFGKQPAVFATESNFLSILKEYKKLIKSGTISEAVIISASGEKDSVWEIKAAKAAGLKTCLIGCNADSSAAHLADKTLVYEKLPEPYTYNTSTYLGLLLGASGERADGILKFIKNLRLPKNLAAYSAYSFILPDKFGAITPMLEIKRHELFGPHLSLRAFSFGEARHAKFVNVWDKELVISFGKNKYFGTPERRWEISLPWGTDNSLVMALAYYIIGKIQGGKKPYFKSNITKYCLEGPRAYGQKKSFPVIVE